MFKPTKRLFRWLFAYKCILEDVRRRQKNWSWSEMEKHRKLVKNYQRAWISKQTERNPYPGVLKTLKVAYFDFAESIFYLGR